VRDLWKFCAAYLLVLVVGCSSIYGVSYDYNKYTNFARLRTYDWLPFAANNENRKNEKIDNINLTRIRTAVSNQLESKGLEVSSEHPDFLIAVYLKTKERLSVINYGGPYVYPYYGYGPYWGTSRIVQYEEGTLLLDFIDPKSKKLIWRGSAKSDLDSVSTPEKREKMIYEAVQKILANFPPPILK
jgi:hypothetical protein